MKDGGLPRDHFCGICRSSAPGATLESNRQSALERGEERLGDISKQGDRYLREPSTAAALAVIR